MKTAKQWKASYMTPEFQKTYTYGGKDLGVSCKEEGAAFLLWSPYADFVTLNLYREGNGSEAVKKIPMTREEKGVWAYRTKEDLHGVYYDYELEIDGEKILSPDPWAKACGVNGKRSMAVDLKRTNPQGWEEDRAPEKEKENIIYELHVKEFSWDKSGGFPEEYRGKYKAFLYGDTTLNQDGVHKTGLSYLKELGVNYVQLMPVYDYGSVDEAGDPAEFNWGYDPVNYNVPEGSYSTDPYRGEVRIREFKEMIQSLHSHGFRVIMDVVYNHTYSLDSPLQKTVPWYYYRVGDDGKPSNGSACGNDIASEMPMCGDYILQSVLYWTEEYHIDGFRFDLMGLLDVELMNRIRRALDEKYGKGEKLLFGEPWAAQKTAIGKKAVQALKKNLDKLDENIGIFCDNTRDAIKGSVFELKEGGFVNGGEGFEEAVLKSVKAWNQTKEAPAKAPSQIITYVSSHDNQTLWDKIAETIEGKEEIERACRLAAGIYMTCQGNLFFLSGEEFGRTKNGLEDSYNAPISINRLDWEKAYEETGLREYYRGLLALRKQLPGLCDKSRKAGRRIQGEWFEKNAAGFYLDNRKDKEESPWETVAVVYNSGTEVREISLPEGEWEILADARDSFLWKNPKKASGIQKVPARGVWIAGKRKQKADR